MTIPVWCKYGISGGRRYFILGCVCVYVYVCVCVCGGGGGLIHQKVENHAEHCAPFEILVNF